LDKCEEHSCLEEFGDGCSDNDRVAVAYGRSEYSGMKMLTILKANRLSQHMWHNTAQHTTTQYGTGTQNSVLTVEHRTQV
jgi:hypothetical protein